MVEISHQGPASAIDLFHILRDGQPRTRTELAKLTGLARPTVASRIETLMKLGLVAPVQDAPSTGGRPSSQFAVNNGARVVFAADIGASHATFALTDLAGKILVRKHEQINVSDGPEEVLGLLVKTCRLQLEQIGRKADEVIAMGIGLPGPVEFSTGRPSNPPIMPGWNNFDVPGWIRTYFPVPVLVDNDVNIMAQGELRSHENVGDLIFVKVSTGIGGGIISGGTLQRGARGIAGDLGHIKLAGSSALCRCGNAGCLEAVASGEAIANTLKTQGINVSSSSDILELVEQGNLTAIQAIRQAGQNVGEVLSACVSLMNPSVIAVGGTMSRTGEHLLAGIRQTVYARSTPLATKHLLITQSRAGENAAIVGASGMAVQYALSPNGINELAHPSA